LILKIILRQIQTAVFYVTFICNLNEKINEKTKGEDIDAFRTPASFQGIEVVFGSTGSGTTDSSGHNILQSIESVEIVVSLEFIGFIEFVETIDLTPGPFPAREGEIGVLGRHTGQPLRERNPPSR